MINPVPDRETTKTPKEFIKILVADDHPLMRQALISFLQKQPDFKVIAEATNGEEALKRVEELIPDVVIMDISMPVMNGLEATRQIKRKYPQIAILVLTVHTDSEHVLGILEAGAAGYLTKSVFGDEIIMAVRSVVAGEAVLTPSILQQIVKTVPRKVTKPISLDPRQMPSAREMEILKLAASGLSNKDIALRMNVSVRTVKGYLADVFSKLGVGSRTEAVMTGLRIGLLTMDDIERNG
jgi:two-component system, NarL family, response regulator LiaR